MNDVKSVTCAEREVFPSIGSDSILHLHLHSSPILSITPSLRMLNGIFLSLWTSYRALPHSLASTRLFQLSSWCSRPPLPPFSRETFLCNPSLLQYLNIHPSRNRLVQNPSILSSMDMTSVAMTRSLTLPIMGRLETVQKSSLRGTGQIRP